MFPRNRHTSILRLSLANQTLATNLESHNAIVQKKHSQSIQWFSSTHPFAYIGFAFPTLTEMVDPQLCADPIQQCTLSSNTLEVQRILPINLDSLILPHQIFIIHQEIRDSCLSYPTNLDSKHDNSCPQRTHRCTCISGLKILQRFAPDVYWADMRNLDSKGGPWRTLINHLMRLQACIERTNSSQLCQGALA